MPCTCRNVDFGTYEAAEVVDIPAHMADYRRARARDGLGPRIVVDRCILPEIRWLWSWGVRTYGSCCGHQKLPPMVCVHDDDAPLMRSLGYHNYAKMPDRIDVFELRG